MYYQKHIFLCNNVKCDGKQCCALGEPDRMRSYAKTRLKELGIQKGEGGVRISLSGCLGRCSEGPLLLVYPDGVWYRYQNEADVERIIREHVVGGEIVKDLMIIVTD